MATIHIEAQGDILALANQSHVKQKGGGTRGTVNVFSKASRRRLIRRFARLRPGKATFITLTYPASFPDPSRAKQDLRALLERFRRRYPQCSAIWRFEFQERGAPHFHLILFDAPFIPFRWLRTWWADIISEHLASGQLPFVRIERCHSKRKVMSYASKYVSKVTSEASALFNNGAYPHVGRHWGVFNKDYLPYAPQVYIRFDDRKFRDLADCKKIMRRIWPGIPTRRSQGCIVYTSKAYLFYEALIRQLISTTPEDLSRLDLLNLGKPN